MTSNANDWHIAQLNVATARFAMTDPRMRGFTDKLDAINALAEASPGFVWRLQGESGNATDVRVDDDPLLIVNLSVWRSVEDLFNFAYRSAHTEVMSLRRHWFERPSERYQVLWWVPAGHAPDAEEALARLRLLRAVGPTSDAFDFKSRHPHPGAPGSPQDMKPEPYCSGWT